MNLTTHNTQHTITKKLNFFSYFLFFFLTLNCNLLFSQNPSGITFHSDSQVACQIFGEDIRDPKEPILIENISESECLKICEGSTVSYFLEGLPPNAEVDWTVFGGTINYQNNGVCNVSWGAAGIGNLTFTISTVYNVITKIICIEKIIKPKAMFTIAPIPNMDDSETLMACAGQTVHFSNLSTNNNGTAILYYLWDFGDGTFSSAFEPDHIYTADGDYEVSLIVTNECSCSEKFVRKIEVGQKGFNIICPGVVCDGQTQTYSLPFSGALVCQGNYSGWSVNGGDLVVNPANGDATVTWNQVDETGFGYLTFNPFNCQVGCYMPSSIKIPVIKNIGTITGNQNMCVGSQGRYKLPQWPTTEFNWEIVGNVNDNLANVILTDQRNEVIIEPYEIGPITLRATYYNTLLDCGGTATFIINVGTFSFTGDYEVCQNAIGNYELPTSITSDWTLLDASNTIIDTLSNSNTYSYNFVDAGTYFLSVLGSTECSGTIKTIKVAETPTTPVATGELLVCPNAPYSYNIVNPNPEMNYVWSVTNGSFVGSNTGTSVTINFNDNSIPTVSVYCYNLNSINCNSSSFILNPTLKQIPAQINGNDVVCANSNNSQYTANFTGTNNPYTEGEIYTWTISNPTVGSISSGQGTNQVNVVWNNVQAVTTVNLILEIRKCTLIKTISKTITVRPTLQIDITTPNATICGNSPITFTIISSSPGVPLDPNAQVVWNFGGATINGGIVQTYQFPNIGTVNILKDVTAYVINPNGCLANSNIASIPITILPQPPATNSISEGGNLFCTQGSIDTVLSASTLTGATIEWYVIPQGSTTAITTGQTGDFFTCSDFGQYFFVATNSFGCSNSSNIIEVVEFCPTSPPCQPPSGATITNNATAGCLTLPPNTNCSNCAVINLIGTVSPTPSYSNWTIIGPGVGQYGVTSPSVTVSTGEYNTFYTAYYECPDGSPAQIASYKKVVIPYVTDFTTTKVCDGNNSFIVTLVDKTNFFTPVNNRNFQYFYKSNVPGSPWIAITTNPFNLPAGNYQIKLIVTGDLDGVPQQPCEKIMPLSLATVPNQSITFTPNQSAFCHDTSVNFFILGNTILTDTYLWTFEPGTTNEATNTLKEPSRVFPTPGVKIIRLTITNKDGCSRTLPDITITIPEKCFNGTMVSSPNNASVCVGESVTINYIPAANECTPANYVWMEGQNPIPNAPNAPSIQVSSPGFYWLKINKGDCKYELPNRITPIFKSLPILTLKAPSTICSNSSVTITTESNATQFNWTIDGIIQPQYANNAQLTLENLSVGNHIVQVVATLNGCSVTRTITITVVSAPDTPVLTYQILSCTPYQVEITATSNVSQYYNWSNGMTGSSIIVSDGGPYGVSLTAGGCEATNQINIPKNPENFIWIFPTGCIQRCLTEVEPPTIIGPQLPLHYWGWELNDTILFEGNGFTPLLHVTQNGTYTYELFTDECGIESQPLEYTITNCEKCEIDKAVLKEIKINEEKFCSFDVILDIENGSSIPIPITLISPDNSLLIVPSSTTLISGPNPYNFTMIPTGNYVGGMVQLQINGTREDGSPCIFEFSITLPDCEEEEHEEGGKISALTNNKNFKVSLAPNPTKEETIISYNGLEENSLVEIYDLTGRLINNYELQNTTGNLIVNTSSLPSGIYIVVVKSNDYNIFQQKLIKE
jgi:hypothetical protein